MKYIYIYIYKATSNHLLIIKILISKGKTIFQKLIKVNSLYFHNNNVYLNYMHVLKRVVKLSCYLYAVELCIS